MNFGILPECQFYKSETGCTLGAECSFPHWEVKEQPNKRPKKGGDKSAISIVKSVRQLACVSRDAEPQESVTISPKGTKVLGPIRRVRFTRAALRQHLRQQRSPSLNKIQVESSHQCRLHAVKFEDRSQEETERRERCARADACNLAKSIYQLNETEKATFYSPSEYHSRNNYYMQFFFFSN